ncbi:MAG: GNAT family N-acetyltransferase [Acidobacteriota bacterium]|nr:GNAT family N-acetyltransferase [Acidobacteriota bacterium]
MSSIKVLPANDKIASTGQLPVIAIPKESFQTETLRGGVEVIERIFDEWTELCEEGASNEPFFRPEWFVVFVENFEKEILLLTVRRAGKLRAVLPLVKRRGNLHGIPVKSLEAVYNLNTQRFDLIHGADETEREEIVKAVWKEIKRQSKWHVLELRQVKKDSWLNDLLALAESENYPTDIWQMDGAPFVSFPQGDDKEKLIEKYFKSLKQHYRRDLKRRLTRLKEQGAVEFVVTRGDQPELMQKFFELEARSWKGRNGTAVACDPKVVKLHDDFARAVAAKNALFIYELKFDGKTIAMSINIMYDRKTIFWKTSYDEEYKRFSPGNLLIPEFLADAIRNDSTELDMLSPATDYKKVWATGEHEHAAFYIFQPGVLGTLLWNWKFSVISRLRKFKKTI